VTVASREVPRAQQAMRSAIDRALSADLTSRELRVFLALVRLVPMFDRLEDRIANKQIADVTGIDARHVRRALGRLAAPDVGVIEREPGSSPAGGARVASLIRFPIPGQDHGPTRPPVDEDRPGAELAPGETDGPGAETATDRGPIPDTTGGQPRPASVVLTEDSPEGACAIARRLVDQQHDEIPAALRPLLDEHGDDLVAEALLELEANGYRERYARLLAGTLATHLPRLKARRREAETQQRLDDQRARTSPATDAAERFAALRQTVRHHATSDDDGQAVAS